MSIALKYFAFQSDWGAVITPPQPPQPSQQPRGGDEGVWLPLIGTNRRLRAPLHYIDPGFPQLLTFFDYNKSAIQIYSRLPISLQLFDALRQKLQLANVTSIRVPLFAKVGTIGIAHLEKILTLGFFEKSDLDQGASTVIKETIIADIVGKDRVVGHEVAAYQEYAYLSSPGFLQVNRKYKEAIRLLNERADSSVEEDDLLTLALPAIIAQMLQSEEEDT